jgi:uncharacterized membrane protein YkoI
MNIPDNLNTCCFSSTFKNHGCVLRVMSSLTGNKKMLIPVALLVAASAVASLAILLPSDASAQTTTPGATNATTTAPAETNATTTAPAEAPERIVGTIHVNENATADQFSEESLKVTAVSATNVAKAQAGNGTVIDAHLAVIHGYLVYDVVVADVPNSNTRTVIVDAGDGKVLFMSPPIPVEKSVIEDALSQISGG